MRVEIVVTRSCKHCGILESELKNMGIPYSIRFAEDDTELLQQYNIKGSPNILVDGTLAFRGMPSFPDLRAYFKKKSDELKES